MILSKSSIPNRVFGPARDRAQQVLPHEPGGRAGKMYAFDLRRRSYKRTGGLGRSLASSGSNQAREGRLVDALAVRGDEGRDTLR